MIWRYAARIIDGKETAPAVLGKDMKVYKDRATKQTTNQDRREKRQEILIKVIEHYEAKANG